MPSHPPSYLTAFAFSMFAQKSIKICAMYDLSKFGLRLDYILSFDDEICGTGKGM